MPDLKYLYHVFYIILNNYSFKQVVDRIKKKKSGLSRVGSDSIAASPKTFKTRI